MCLSCRSVLPTLFAQVAEDNFVIWAIAFSMASSSNASFDTWLCESLMAACCSSGLAHSLCHFAMSPHLKIVGGPKAITRLLVLAELNFAHQ
jgi:hypothetical protein